jgi:hypothetical protein
MNRLQFTGPFIGVQKNLDSSFSVLEDAEDASNVNLNLGTIQKRPGWTFHADVSDGGAALGIYEYVKLDGSKTQLVKAGGTLQKISSGSVIQLETGFSSSELPSFVTINDKCYILDGSIFKVTDGTTVFDAPIARPASAPTLGSASAGVLNGVYDYKYTWYSSTWGQESPASDASAVTTLSDQQIVITMSTTRPDTRVDKKRIYRRKVSASESVWSFYKEIAYGTATDTDNTRDVDLDATSIAPLSLSTSLPGLRYAAYQAGVLFLAGDATNDLYFSRVGTPWELSSAVTIGSSGDSDPITGLWAFQGVVIVFKRHSIWLVSGNTKDTIYPRKITSGIGCSAGHSIVEVDGKLYFLGERSFYIFDGASDPVDIGERVREDIVTRNYARDPYVVGGHDHANGAIYWSYSGNQSGSNNRFYAYFYSNSIRTEQRSWIPWSFNPEEVTSIGMFSDPATNVRSVYLGFASGAVAELGGNSDNGTEIIFFWKTGRIDLKKPFNWKRWGEFTIEFTKRTTASNIDVRYYLDGGAQTALGSSTQLTPVLRKYIGQSSRDIQLEIYGANDQPNEVIGWEMNAEVAGRYT